MALILSIETSTNVCSVALHANGLLVGHQLHEVEKSHSSLLPGIVLTICKEAGVSTDEIQGIAVSEGPGSYTGLRIGVTTAKGLAYTLDKKLIGVSTLECMVLKGQKLFQKGGELACH